MNISVTRQNQDFIAALVKGGRYASASEVVREAIRLLEDREERRRAWMKHLRGLLKEGEADIAAGRLHDVDDVREMLLADIEKVESAAGPDRKVRKRARGGKRRSGRRAA
jgi:antitoxin ParD1/3/4